MRRAKVFRILISCAEAEIWRVKVENSMRLPILAPETHIEKLNILDLSDHKC